MDNYKIYASEQFVEEKIKESQADMSQNDENAAGYVKNRTHWIETTETTLIDNESYVAADLFEIGLPAFALSTALELVEGAIFTVVLNDVEYQATCRWAADASGGAVLGMGNLELLGLPTDGIDTECPFIMANQDGITAVLISPDVASIGDTITLNIIRVIEEVHQIDSKFLPDTIKTHWAEDTGIQVLEEITIPASEFVDNSGLYIAEISLEELPTIDTDKFYNVVWDGQDYLCRGYSDIDNVGLIPDGVSMESALAGDKIPFMFMMGLGGVMVITSYLQDHTIAITECNVHQINTAYIPDSISRVGRLGVGDHSEIFNDYIDSTASGQYAHSEGKITHADGDYSHAEGGSTEANGDYSHAEGDGTEANGVTSHTEGDHTIAGSKSQHVQGKYNIEDTTDKYAHIVGNGDSDDTRSNAHTIDWDGTAWFAGEVKIGGAGQDDAEAKTLATTEYIDNKFSTSNLNTLTVGNATSADKVAQSLKFGSKTYNGSSEQTITAGDLGLESAIRFVGITATAITDGGTQSPVIDGETHVPIRGDVVINSNTDQEFIWNGSAWEEMGNSSSHALKTISISAGSGLTGGGTLEANRTISHADTSTQASVSASGRRYITGVTLDTYGHVTGLTTGTETVTDTDTKVTQAAVITTNGAYPVLLGYSTATTEVTNTVNKSSKMTFNPSTGQLAIQGAASTSTATGALKVTGGVGVSGSIYAGSVYGAVWNDYAEYREGTAQFEPGRVICENGDDTLSLATERLQPGANVVSDTFGFAIGETEQAKTPIAVSGRVLVYPYEDRNSYAPGDAVCAAPNGTVSKMTREEIREYPERIIGTVSAIPEYETWGTGNVPVNGRIWIKIK